MLIIPVENKPDWRNPPIATLLLIIINIIVFFGYQSKDEQRIEVAQNWYGNVHLLAQERAPFLDYLAKQKPEVLEKLKQHGLVEPENANEEGQPSTRLDDVQFQYAYADDDFVHALHQQLDQDETWRQRREQFEKLTSRFSVNAYGFIPAEARWYTWFTSLFLHGGLDHILGNMVFLFLFGFALEIAIGRGVFLLLYVLSGLGGNLLYWAANQGSHVAVIGASGAISGLMGMYIALYGLRKINFFYSVLFYASNFRAPALIVFPVWVIYELYGAWRGGDGIGHWAHSGGLLFGFVLLALWMRFGLKYNQDYVEKKENNAPWKEKLTQLQSLISSMRFTEAKQQGMALAAAYPHAAEVWQVLYDLVKISPASKEYHQVAHQLFKQVRTASQNPALKLLIDDTVADYAKLGGATPAFTEATSIHLLQRMTNKGDVVMTKYLLDRLLSLNSVHEQMPRFLQSAINLTAKSGDMASSQQYRNILRQQFPRSEEARQSLT